MIVYLDANVVIYLVEHHPTWEPRVVARLGRLAPGDVLAVSDATRLECLVGPLISGDAGVLADYAAFFSDPRISVFPVTAAVFERAARIRAAHRFLPLDAMHLAAAVEYGCGLFLTNDAQLTRFPDLPVEVLS
jgi:predicted nucleic acid-binding protein